MCLIKYASRYEDILGSAVIVPSFLTSALDEVVSFKPLLLYPPPIPPEQFPRTHWKEGWVGPRASLDAVEKRKIFPLPGINPSCPNNDRAIQMVGSV
jgi:hypothetical protein